MREYIVTKDILNIRSSASDVSDDNFIGSLNKGTSLFLLDDEITGTIPKGGSSNIWRSDSNNRFVSDEGIRLKDYEDKKKEFLKNSAYKHLHNDSTDEKNWNVAWGFVDLEIWKLWDKYSTKGKNIKIAVIDSGINYNLPCFQSKSITYYNALKETDSREDCIDTLGHGSNLAALLCGTAPNCGIIPDSSLIVMKVTNGNNVVDTGALVNAFKKAIELGAHVISFSNGYPPKDKNHEKIHQLIQESAKAKIIVCASAGNNGEADFLDKSYPASFDECLSIGALTADSIRWKESSKSSFLKLTAPGGPFPSVFKTTDIITGTSYSTPIVAGCIGLLLAIGKQRNLNPDQPVLFKHLQKTALTKLPGYNIEEYGWGKIDIQEAVRSMLNP